MGWITVADGYEVALCDGGDGTVSLAARNAKGKRLARVPTKLKKDPDVARLNELRAWLGEHETSVRAEVEAWMLRSLPVPLALLRAVWPDAAWRRALTDLVVASIGDGGAPDLARCGLLRAVDGERGVGVVDLDGETVWPEADAFAVPHPVLLGDDLADWRELAVSLGLAQPVPQLLREVWRRPESMDPQVNAIDAFSFTEYERGSQFEKQVIALGGRIRGETAYFRCYDDEPVPVKLGLRWQGPEASTYFTSLTWSRPGTAIGDIAWSEGVRIAATLYANRTAGEDGEPAPAAAYERFCAGHLRAAEPSAAPAAPAARPPRSREALLRAGAVLAGPPAAETEDTLVACCYESPALEGPVVETTARAAVAGQRTALALLGLTPTHAAAETDLGTVRARPLGFLALALNRHPALSDRVTVLLPGLRANAKLAQTKPGRARDALNRIAADLTGPAAELLPVFYDECSRIMAEVGSNTYSVGFFELARRTQAEQAAAFPVDEAAVVTAYRDIAVGNALPGSLKTHAAALADRLPAAQAHHWQRRLVTEWCEAGRRAAPVLAQGLVKLAAAAGHEPGGSADPHERAADERAARAMLANGTLAGVPWTTWDSLSPLLHRLAAEDRAVRAALVRLLPEPARDSAKARSAAAAVLVANLAGAGGRAPFTGTPELTGEDVRRWLEGALELYQGLALPVEGLAEVLGDAGERLRADGLTCDLHRILFRDRRSMGEAPDHALFDLALACGVPVDSPGSDADLGLTHWTAKGKGTDLAAVAAHPQWGPALRRDVLGERSNLLGLGRPSGNRSSDEAHADNPGGFPATAKAAKRLTTAPGTAGAVADALAEHARLVPGAALPDLYPALRDTERFTLAGPPKAGAEAVRAIVVGADPAAALAAVLRSGVLDELELPAFADFTGPLNRCNLLESGGDLIIAHPASSSHRSRRAWAAAVRPDRTGPRRELPDPFGGPRQNQDCYVVIGDDVLATAHGGPHCPHVEDLPAGFTRHPEALTPRAGAEEEAVRLPGADGDATVHRLPGRTVELRGADGRAVGRYVMGASWLPGRSGAITAALLNHRYAAGTELVAPPGWWGRMRARDEAGSRALRRIGDADARRLLAAVDAGLGARIVELTDARPPRYRLPELDACFAELIGRLRPLLPEITDRRLWFGVTAMVWTAVECRERVFALAERLRLDPPAHLDRAPEAAPHAESTPAESSGSVQPAPLPPAPSGAVPAAEGLRSERAALYASVAATAKAAAAHPHRLNDPVAVFDSGHIQDLRESLGRLGRAALRAAWSTDDAWRERRSELLRDLAAVPELIDTGGSWHRVRQAGRSGERGEVRSPGRTYSTLCLGSGYSAEAVSRYWVALLYHSPRPLGDNVLASESVLEARTCRGWGDARRLDAVADLCERRGAARGREAAVMAFAEATGVSVAQAAVLLSPFTGSDGGWSRNTTEVWNADRAHFAALGLTERNVWAAARFLSRTTGGAEPDELIEALVPEDPEQLWSQGPDAARAAAHWLRRHPRIAPVPDEVWTGIVGHHFYGDLPHPEALLDLLATQARALRVEGARSAAAGPAYLLPPGHPAGPVAAERLRALRAACADPATRVRVRGGVRVAAMEKVAGAVATHLADGELAVGGALVLVPGGQDYVLWLRPAWLDGPADPLLGRLTEEFTRSQPRSDRRRTPVAAPGVLTDVAFLLSEASARMADDLESVDGPRQDPLHSVPRLVAEASAAHGLSEDAARLYLQVIALPDPDDANVRRWNGWDEERRAAAAAELAATKLVVTGTRKGAARTLFAPGPWREHGYSSVGVEVDKLTRTPGGGPGMLVHVPAVPLTDVFTAAWRDSRP
ncbi:hypothetical protein HDA32_002538 [Spinactinospora alkalitolerans]|uniref:DUF4132 domain-containing protein n=1 Tax=Spinactinospora alkalitolerans TaxID=687207 RepID=A0A852TU04_9ACTN|nr:DUF4132 domain-containing protein [Spinactinospora alkalitolerans]NYE47418.1 hypothetical protein [Spinactinospora alkalitolerans]